MNDYDRIAKALSYIKENYTSQPKLNEIADHIHLSPYHFHRLFKRWAGVTPKNFLKYISIEHAKNLLQKDHTVEETSFEIGLSSISRLHDLFVSIEGMTPGEFKNKGKNLILNYLVYDTPFGPVIISSTEKGITNISFIDQKEDAEAILREKWPSSTLIMTKHRHHYNALQIFDKNWKDLSNIKLHLKGTEFQLKVWETLLKIPFGSVNSYSGIAEKIDRPNSQRAVANAVANNPVAFLIPCHRVIKKLGEIGEYRWGAARKMSIIGWEFSQNQVNGY